MLFLRQKNRQTSQGEKSFLRYSSMVHSTYILFTPYYFKYKNGLFLHVTARPADSINASALCLPAEQVFCVFQDKPHELLLSEA